MAEFVEFLDGVLKKNNVECGHPRTAARMLDKVSQSIWWPVSQYGGLSVNMVACQSIWWPVSQYGGLSL